MRKLNFKSIEEFEDLFHFKNESIADSISDSIREAVTYNKKSDQLFEITFETSDQVYEIALGRKQWKFCLEKLLDYYHSLNAADKCIDTWQLIQEVKEWE